MFLDTNIETGYIPKPDYDAEVRLYERLLFIM
jgi:hypothetical protein